MHKNCHNFVIFNARSSKLSIVVHIDKQTNTPEQGVSLEANVTKVIFLFPPFPILLLLLISFLPQLSFLPSFIHIQTQE